ncbi:MAG: hypothetical protein LBD89_00630 [Tannerellaceae bacterium]|jgi:hypothetical protein|nr:hypothetical protein [Tannerellaceae bacterium]
MKPNLLLLLISFHLYPPIYAIDNLRTGDARSIGMGGNEATASPVFNPALITLYERNTLRINCFNRYALKELGSMNANLYLPGKTLSVGGDVASFGYDAYRESMFRFFMAKPLTKQWNLGISVQCALLQTELYEEQPTQLSVDVGLTYIPVDKLLTGLLITNCPSVSFGGKSAEKKEFMYYMIQAGFQWELINNVFISGALSTGEDYVAAGSLGFEYVAFQDFCLRAGLRSAPMLPSFGFGYAFSNFHVDVAAVYHTVLGISTGLGLSYSF